MFDRIVVVTKSTELSDLLDRHHSRDQVKFFLELRGQSIEEKEEADKAYRLTLDSLLAGLPRDIPHHLVRREHLVNFLFREHDLVVLLGPDGLYANCAKYLDGQPILGINPDPLRVDGVLMRFTVSDALRFLPAVLAGKFRTDTLTLAQAVTSDKQVLLAANDFLIGRRDQISARYVIEHEGRAERQSSSGVLVSTGCGSSGWLTSVFCGAMGVTGGWSEDTGAGERAKFPWSAPYLKFVVREPFPSRYTKTSILSGTITTDSPLKVVSEMAEGGVVFSDGVPEDALEFNSGCTLTVTPAAKTASLIAKP